MLLDDLNYLADSNRNKSNLKIINSSISSGSLSHAYIFCGFSIDLLYNITLAFASSINCENNGCGNCKVCKNTLKGIHENVIILEPDGNNITIDRIMQLQRFMSVTAYSPGYKICIIKEAELLNREAANRLLKTLEDPPDDKSIFVLLSEDLSAIIPTIISRCIIFEWDFVSAENNAAMHINGDLLKSILDDGIMKVLSTKDDFKICMDLSSQVTDFIKDSFKPGDDADRTHIEQYKNTGATAGEIKKLEETLRAKNRRKLNKYGNLGINIVFDIITAWLEDILAVCEGVSQEALNMPDNFDFIKATFSMLENRKVFELMDTIEKNRKYLKYSIYTELSLDNIFLQMQLLKNVNY